jgi:hypothetical protein
MESAGALAGYHDFFIASAGAAAALTGLLFVAISITTDKTFGEKADLVRRLAAERTFTAFTNVFFISMAALLPHQAIGGITAIAALSLLQVARIAVLAWRRGQVSWRQVGLISIGIYAFELQQAIQVLQSHEMRESIVWIAFGLYAYALGSSWNLLGASDAKPS